MKKTKVDTPFKNSWADTVQQTDWKKLQPKTNHVFVKSITFEQYKKSIGMA